MAGCGMRGARKVLAAVLVATTSSFSIAMAQQPGGGQVQAGARTFDFDIPAKPVPQAVNDIGRITGLSVVFRENGGMAATGKPVRGSMTAEQALTVLLSGTGFSYRFSNARTIQIYDPSQASDAGSSDATALEPIILRGATETTEGSGSYRAETVTIGKTARNLREIPNAVAVVTRQQIEDQDLTSVQDVVGATNGATLIKNDDVNERTELQFRGFVASSLQVDGTSMSANNDMTTFDTAIYDRVEVLKGPAGILQGRASPVGRSTLSARSRLTSARSRRMPRLVHGTGGGEKSISVGRSRRTAVCAAGWSVSGIREIPLSISSITIAGFSMAHWSSISPTARH